VAKRGSRRRATRLDKAAAGIGRALGQTLKRLEKWRSQRAAIAGDIRKVLAAGRQALADLGEGNRRNGSYVHLRRTRTVYRVARKPSPRRFSAAARRKLSLAAKARWAVAKRAGKNSLG
jgi:hypothetical protein